MKIFRFLIAVLVVFILVACTPNQEMETVTVERPTVLATAVVEAADTLPPPAATSEITATLEIRGTDTHIPATPISEVMLTATVEPTITPTLAAPLPKGQIAFLWDPDPDLREGPGPTPTHNFYFALPGATPETWQIQTALTDLYGWPRMIPSPDKSQFALILLDDTNGDGTFDPNRGIDIRNLYVYTLANGSLVRLTNAERNIFYLSWLPDNQSIVYDQTTNLFLVKTDGLPSQQLTNNATLPAVDNTQYDRITNMTGSPDGRLQALNIESGIGSNGGIRPFADSLIFFDMDSGEVIPVAEDVGAFTLNLKWSPDGRWLAFTHKDGQRLFVADANTLEIIELSAVPTASYPAWSPDSRWLAFVEDSTLMLWDANTVETRELATADHLGQSAWAPDGSQIVIPFTENDQAGLLWIDPNNGSQQQQSLVATPLFLTWSPDGQWLLFYLFQDDQSALYVTYSGGGEPYRVLVTGGERSIPSDMTWLPAN